MQSVIQRRGISDDFIQSQPSPSTLQIDNEHVINAPQDIAALTLMQLGSTNSLSFSQWDGVKPLNVWSHLPSSMIVARPTAESPSVDNVTSASSFSIFICHSGEQKPFALWVWLGLEALKQELKLDFNVFFDRPSLYPGGHYPTDIAAQLYSTKIAIILLDSTFFHKEWPMKECFTFFKRQQSEGNDSVKILPVFIGSWKIALDQTEILTEQAAAGIPLTWRKNLAAHLRSVSGEASDVTSASREKQKLLPVLGMLRTTLLNRKQPCDYTGHEMQRDELICESVSEAVNQMSSREMNAQECAVAREKVGQILHCHQAKEDRIQDIPVTAACAQCPIPAMPSVFFKPDELLSTMCEALRLRPLQSTLSAVNAHALPIQPSVPVCIWGLDGMGKSTLLYYIGRELAPKAGCDIVFYFGDPTIVQTQYFDIAQALGLLQLPRDIELIQGSKKGQNNVTDRSSLPRSRQDVNTAVLQTKEWLTKHADRVLLIFDDVKDEESINDFLPPMCRVLVSTRRSNLGASKCWQSVAITKMKENDAVSLLQSYLDRETQDRGMAADTDLRRLAVALEYLPLAIIQAAIHIQEQCITIDRYLELFRSSSQWVKLDGSLNAAMVAICMNIQDALSISKNEREFDDASRRALIALLLSSASLCANHQTQELLDHCVMMINGPTSPLHNGSVSTVDTHFMSAARTRLCRFGLLRIQSRNCAGCRCECWSMHSVVQKVVLALTDSIVKYQDGDQLSQLQWPKNALLLSNVVKDGLVTAFEAIDRSLERKEVRESILIPHVYKLLQLASPADFVATQKKETTGAKPPVRRVAPGQSSIRLLFYLARYDVDIGSFATSVVHFADLEKQCGVWSKAPKDFRCAELTKPSSEQLIDTTADLLSEWGRALLGLDDYEAAVSKLSQALKTMNQRHMDQDSTRDLKVKRTTISFAAAKGKLGQLGDARRILRQVEEQLKPPSIVITGSEFSEEFYLPGTESLNPNVDAQQALVLAECLYTLGDIENQAGQPSVACQCLQQAVKIYQEHQDYGAFEGPLVCVHRLLGAAFHATNQFEQSREQLNHALVLERRKYGNDHFTVSATLMALATLELRLCNYEDALELTREAVKIRRRVLQQLSDSQKLLCLRRLARSYALLNQHTEAQMCLNEAHELAQQRHTKDPNAIRPLVECKAALLWHAVVQGKWKTGERYGEEALQLLQRTVQGSCDFMSQNINGSASETQQSLRLNGEAQGEIEEKKSQPDLLKPFESSGSSSSASKYAILQVEVLRHLAICDQQLNKFDLQRTHIDEALRLLAFIPDADPLVRASLLMMVSTSEMISNSLLSSIRSIQEAISDLERYFGEFSVYLVTYVQMLGFIYSLVEDTLQSKAQYERALSIQQLASVNEDSIEFLNTIAGLALSEIATSGRSSQAVDRLLHTIEAVNSNKVGYQHSGQMLMCLYFIGNALLRLRHYEIAGKVLTHNLRFARLPENGGANSATNLALCFDLYSDLARCAAECNEHDQERDYLRRAVEASYELEDKVPVLARKIQHDSKFTMMLVKLAEIEGEHGNHVAQRNLWLRALPMIIQDVGSEVVAPQGSVVLETQSHKLVTGSNEQLVTRVTVLQSKWEAGQYNPALSFTLDENAIVIRRNLRGARSAVALSAKPLPTFRHGSVEFLYYEAHIDAFGSNSAIGVGFAPASYALDAMPGWQSNSFGWHGDDGKKFHATGEGAVYGPRFAIGDRIGCLVDLTRKQVLWTLNGRVMSVAFSNIDTSVSYHACIGMQGIGDQVTLTIDSEPAQWIWIQNKYQQWQSMARWNWIKEHRYSQAGQRIINALVQLSIAEAQCEDFSRQSEILQYLWLEKPPSQPYNCNEVRSELQRWLSFQERLQKQLSPITERTLISIARAEMAVEEVNAARSLLLQALEVNQLTCTASIREISLNSTADDKSLQSLSKTTNVQSTLWPMLCRTELQLGLVEEQSVGHPSSLPLSPRTFLIVVTTYFANVDQFSPLLRLISYGCYPEAISLLLREMRILTLENIKVDSDNSEVRELIMRWAGVQQIDVARLHKVVLLARLLINESQSHTRFIALTQQVCRAAYELSYSLEAQESWRRNIALLHAQGELLSGSTQTSLSEQFRESSTWITEVEELVDSAESSDPEQEISIWIERMEVYRLRVAELKRNGVCAENAVASANSLLASILEWEKKLFKFRHLPRCRLVVVHYYHLLAQLNDLLVTQQQRAPMLLHAHAQLLSLLGLPQAVAMIGAGVHCPSVATPSRAPARQTSLDLETHCCECLHSLTPLQGHYRCTLCVSYTLCESCHESQPNLKDLLSEAFSQTTSSLETLSISSSANVSPVAIPITIPSGLNLNALNLLSANSTCKHNEILDISVHHQYAHPLRHIFPSGLIGTHRCPYCTHRSLYSVRLPYGIVGESKISLCSICRQSVQNLAYLCEPHEWVECHSCFGTLEAIWQEASTAKVASTVVEESLREGASTSVRQVQSEDPERSPAVLNQFLTIAQKIIENPDERKYRRIDLKKVAARKGERHTAHLERLLLAAGFRMEGQLFALDDTSSEIPLLQILTSWAANDAARQIEKTSQLPASLRCCELHSSIPWKVWPLIQPNQWLRALHRHMYNRSAFIELCAYFCGQLDRMQREIGIDSSRSSASTSVGSSSSEWLSLGPSVIEVLHRVFRLSHLTNFPRCIAAALDVLDKLEIGCAIHLPTSNWVELDFQPWSAIRGKLINLSFLKLLKVVWFEQRQLVEDAAMTDLDEHLLDTIARLRVTIDTLTALA